MHLRCTTEKMKCIAEKLKCTADTVQCIADTTKCIADAVQKCIAKKVQKMHRVDGTSGPENQIQGHEVHATPMHN